MLCLLLPSGFVPYVCDKLAKVSVCCVCCYLQVLFHVCVISWQKSVCAVFHVQVLFYVSVISWPKSLCVVFAVTFRFCSMCV